MRAAARCARRPGPTRPGPSTISPLRRRQTPPAVWPARRASSASTHGEKSAGDRRGKGEQEVAEIAFRIDRDDGDAVDRRFFDQVDAETGLAAAGHAGDHGVRDEIRRIVEKRCRRCGPWCPDRPHGRGRTGRASRNRSLTNLTIRQIQIDRARAAGRVVESLGLCRRPVAHAERVRDDARAGLELLGNDADAASGSIADSR